MTNQNEQPIHLSNDEHNSNKEQLHEPNASMTSKETREIVTPHAFFVSDELYGTPLATPARRAVALTIDMILVVLVAQVNGFILACVAAWTFFSASNRLKAKNQSNGMQFFLRILVALLLFIAVYGAVELILKDDEGDRAAVNSGSEVITVSGLDTTVLAIQYASKTYATLKEIEAGKCNDSYQCVEELAIQLASDITDLGLNKEAVAEIYSEFVNNVSDVITAEEKIKLEHYFETVIAEQFSAPSSASITLPNEDESSVIEGVESTDDEMHKKSPEKTSRAKGIISWVKQLAEDLGLGFGWAAVYFSLFTTWWKGQTPGKKLMRIKVIKLDNTSLTLWDSFGRYGGYGAGIATGLLGFLQIYWDPNRQAIQDKISTTLVVDLRGSKVPYVKE